MRRDSIQWTHHCTAFHNAAAAAVWIDWCSENNLKNKEQEKEKKLCVCVMFSQKSKALKNY